MQSMPLMAFAPPQPVDKPRAVEPVAKTADSNGAGPGSGRESFADENAGATGLFRSAVAVRAEQAEPETPPLDTRVVGDLDKIDPLRPTARMPDPIVTLEDLRDVAPVAVAPEDPAEAEAVTENAEAGPAVAAEVEAGNSAAIDSAPEFRPPLPPTPPAPSPAAVAPEVPDPAPPGQYDLRR